VTAGTTTTSGARSRRASTSANVWSGRIAGAPCAGAGPGFSATVYTVKRDERPKTSNGPMASVATVPDVPRTTATTRSPGSGLTRAASGTAAASENGSEPWDVVVRIPAMPVPPRVATARTTPPAHHDPEMARVRIFSVVLIEP